MLVKGATWEFFVDLLPHVSQNASMTSTKSQQNVITHEQCTQNLGSIVLPFVFVLLKVRSLFHGWYIFADAAWSICILFRNEME